MKSSNYSKAQTWREDAIAFRTRGTEHPGWAPLPAQDALEMANLCEEIAILFETGNQSFCFHGFDEEQVI